jgi:hypothetical protein
MDPATRDSWKTAPIGPVVPVGYQDSFDGLEFERLRVGLVPREMEDKWFIYFDHMTAFLHRSWTGQHIYTVEFEQHSDGTRVRRAGVAAAARQGEADVAMIRFLLRGLILGGDVPFPIPRDVSRDKEAIYKHALVGRQPTATVRVEPARRLARVRRELARTRQSILGRLRRR